MKFLLVTTFVACVFGGAYAGLPQRVLTLTENGKVGRCTAMKVGDQIKTSCDVYNNLDPNNKIMMDIMYPGETPITWNEFIMKIALADGPTAGNAQAGAPAANRGLPEDVLTFTKDGKVARCTATKIGDQIQTSCQVYSLDPNNKRLMDMMFPGETPISYDEFQARVHNPTGVTADTAEAPVPTSFESRGYVKQELQTPKGAVPVLTLVAP